MVDVIAQHPYLTALLLVVTFLTADGLVEKFMNAGRCPDCKKDNDR